MDSYINRNVFLTIAISYLKAVSNLRHWNLYATSHFKRTLRTADPLLIYPIAFPSLLQPFHTHVPGGWPVGDIVENLGDKFFPEELTGQWFHIVEQPNKTG